MPLNLSATLTGLINAELGHLCTLWDIVRRDGQQYHFTDHDVDIVFNGDTYKCGVGYDRTAIEDKSDFSSDSLDVSGVLSTTDISREDIRGGLFDGAEVWIRVIDYTNPQPAHSMVRRRGWFGEVKQNNLGQFNTELRGLSDALSEMYADTYTPGCPVDLGSPRCGVALFPANWNDETTYRTNALITIPSLGFIFRATTAGVSNANSDHNPSLFNVALGATVTDGTVVWTRIENWQRIVTVSTSPAPDRRNFTMIIDSPNLVSDPRYYDGGLVRFETGDNAGILREIKSANLDSGGEVSLSLYLRMPFNVSAGDTFTIWPGCDKSPGTCQSRFSNIFNFQGFPYVPGDNYLKVYPDAKE